MEEQGEDERRKRIFSSKAKMKEHDEDEGARRI